jgi:maltose O-acetyltransferase
MLRPVPAGLGIRLRRICYRPFFAGLGRSVRIAEGVQIRAPWGITLKDEVAVNFGASLDGQGRLTCEERALIGPYAVLHTTEHVRPKPGDNYRYRFEPVTVGAWAVVTAHVVVTAGTSIGSAALVGAGAVVTHDVAGGEVVGGVPARTIMRSSDGSTSSQDHTDGAQS